MSTTIGERLKLGLRTALPSIVVFLILLNVLLALDLRWNRGARDPTRVFSFLDDTAVLIGTVALSILLPRVTITLAM